MAQNSSKLSVSSFVPWLIIVSSSALVFGYWFKTKQLTLFAPEILPFYPKLYWAHSLGATLIAFWCLWLSWPILLSLFCDLEKPNNILAMDSLSFLNFWIPLGGFSLGVTVLSFTLVRIVFLLQAIRLKQVRIKSTWRGHVIALTFILYCLLFFKGFLSPYSWDNPIYSLRRGESHVQLASSPLHQINYPNAKKFELSGIDPSYFSGLPHSPVTEQSLLIPALALIFDLPSADPLAFFRAHLISSFFWALFSSFGFYLFCLMGLELSLPVSVLGGFLFLFSNGYIGMLLAEHSPYFSGAFLNLPFAMLSFRLSVVRKRLSLALLAGALLGSCYYLQQQHPDALIQAVAYFAAYALFEIIFLNEGLGVRRGLLHGIAAGVGLVCMVSWALGPLLYEVLQHNARIIPHLELPEELVTGREGLIACGIPILKSLGWFLPFVLVVIASLKAKNLFEEKQRKRFLFFIGFTGFLYVVLVPVIGPSLIYRFLELTSPRFLSLHNMKRLYVYISLSALISVLIALNVYVKQAFELNKKMALFFCGVTVMTAAILFARPGVFGILYLSGGILFFGIYQLLMPSVKSKCVVAALALSSVASVMWESSYHWMSPKRQNNAENCQTYVSMQSLLTKTMGLGPADQKANLRLLDDRYLAFLKMQSAPGSNGVKGEKSLSRDIHFFRSHFSTIDRHYQQFRCHDAYSDSSDFSKFGFDLGISYNLMSLFYEMDPPGLTVKSGTLWNYLQGIGPGVAFHEGAIGYDSRYTVGYPPLNALYTSEKEYFENQHFVGQHQVAKSSSAFLKNPRLRKKMNIAGLDLYLLSAEDAAGLDGISSVQRLPNPSQWVPAPFVLVRDLSSYGFAYLAREIVRIKDQSVPFHCLLPPFGEEDREKYARYASLVNESEDRLMSLRGKHAILLESPVPDSSEIAVARSIPVDDFGTEGNELKVIQISNNRVLFQSHCRREPCQLVMNRAALPQWRAFVESTPVPIERANYAFISARIPMGTHLVWFEYRSPAEILGYYVSSGLVLLLCAALYLFKFSDVRRVKNSGLPL